MKSGKNLRRLGLMALPLLGSSVAAPAFAIDFGTDLLYSYESSDNIDRAEDSAAVAPQDGIRQSIFGTLSASTRSQQLDMDMDLSLGVTKSVRDDETAVTTVDTDDESADASLALYALFNLRPGQISWLFADYAVQQGDDLAELSDRDERTLSNFFVTGPSTKWRVTPVDTFNLDLFYLLADEEGDPEQTRQLNLQADWSHRFSRRHSAGLHVEQSDISYKESDDKFGITNVYARYSYEQGKTLLDFDAGTSSSTDEDASDNSKTTTDETLLRLGLTRQMSREMEITFDASQVFNDETLSTIRDLQSNLDSGLDVGVGPFYEKRVALGVNRGDDIWNAGLSLSNSAMEFTDDESQVDDRTTQRASLEMGYALNRLWGLRAVAARAEIDYDNIVRTDEETDFGFGVSYQFAVSWGASLDWEHSLIDSNRPNALTAVQEDVSIEENSVTFSVYWQPQTKLARLRQKYERLQIENVLE